MTEKAPRTVILPSDADAQGNVTLWDHGPQPVKKEILGETEQAKAGRLQAEEADAKIWHAKNGDIPMPLIMHQSDAAHSMTVDPHRYSMEPGGIDEGEIEKRVEEIRKKREAAANAPQNALDRKTAIIAIMSDRLAAKTAAEVEATPAEPEQTGATGPAWYPSPDPNVPGPIVPEPILPPTEPVS